MRIQILELPSITSDGGRQFQTPFALVLDQASDVPTADCLHDIAKSVGAETVLVFADTVEVV